MREFESPPAYSAPPANVSRLLKTQALILGGFLLLIWALELFDQLFLGGRLDSLGVRPGRLAGLSGILFMPFLHDGLAHVLANSLPFAVLGWLVMVRRLTDFFLVAAVAALVAGLGVWLFGREGTVHVGASGLIFGFFGYLLLRAYFERSLASISLALLVLLLYGGLLCGVLPSHMGVSWQAHLFGFLGGVLAAYWLGNNH
ncbi:MAG: rhomboid family intramembrane serine protease [Candidatus Promineifilaceae bacterium]